MRVVVTGAAGFIGSHIVEYLLKYTSAEVVGLDCLTYAARLDSVWNFNKQRFSLICHDFRYPISNMLTDKIGSVDYIIHNGAESHVARSFENPRLFVESNVFGTMNLLEYARRVHPEKFVYVSTDEVFGQSHGRAFTEDDTLNPTNPYAGTKAAAEQLVYGYHRSYGLPTVISRTMNVFGERQHYEKFIPKVISKILHGEKVDIHISPTGEIGTRHWVYAGEQALGLWELCRHGKAGEIYHISSGVKKSNLWIAKAVADILCEKLLQLRYKIPDEPIHDLHYSIDATKIKQIYTVDGDFNNLLAKTVLWYKDHPDYLEEME